MWLVSEWWPDDLLSAIQTAMLPRGDSRRVGQASGRVSMPLAELWSTVAVLEAVVAARLAHGEAPPGAVIACGDCSPACSALDKGVSPLEQMRSVLARARGVAPRWLGVHLRRELNKICDTLSHPADAHRVEAAAVAAGLEVRWAAVSRESWRAARSVAALQVGRLGLS